MILEVRIIYLHIHKIPCITYGTYLYYCITVEDILFWIWLLLRIDHLLLYPFMCIFVSLSCLTWFLFKLYRFTASTLSKFNVIDDSYQDGRIEMLISANFSSDIISVYKRLKALLMCRIFLESCVKRIENLQLYQ